MGEGRTKLTKIPSGETRASGITYPSGTAELTNDRILTRVDQSRCSLRGYANSSCFVSRSSPSRYEGDHSSERSHPQSSVDSRMCKALTSNNKPTILDDPGLL